MIKAHIILSCLVGLTILLHSNVAYALPNGERSGSVAQMCSKFQNKDKLKQQIYRSESEGQQYASYISQTFKMSGNDLVNSLTQNQSVENLMSKLSSMASQIAIFVGPYAIPLLINLLIWPFLLCCCCCPNDCPPRCCQKEDKQSSTKLQILMPAISLIFLFLLVIVASAMGIRKASSIQQSYYIVGCSISLTFDNILNGNVSNQGNYWAGLNQLQSGFETIKYNMAAIKTEIIKIRYTNTSSPLRIAYQQGSNLITSVSKIPDNNIGGTMPAYTYPHFDSSPGNIDSLFPSLLGAAQMGNVNGEIGTCFTAINNYNEYLKDTGENAENFCSQTDSKIIGNIDKVLSSINPIKIFANMMNTNLGLFVDLLTPIFQIATITLYVVFAVCIGLSILGILSILPMTISDVYSCRLLLYAIFPIFNILAMACLFIATSLSAVTPAMHLACDFMDVSISSGQTFQKNLAPILGKQIVKNLQTCISGGTGDLINQLDGIDLTSINSFTSSSLFIATFNSSIAQNVIGGSLVRLIGFVESYYFTDKFDFSSDYDLNIMKAVSNPNNYVTCTTNSFQSDSWVPSLQQSQIICTGTSSNASQSQCPNSSSITAGRGTTSASVGCFGCMDSTRILLNSVNPVNDINSRYGAVGQCGVWASKMQNLWNNYYSLKKSAISPVRSRSTASLSLYNTPSTGYFNLLSNVQSNLIDIKSNLNLISSTVFNPQYGMISGLNCQVLGQDLQMTSDSICISLFSTLNYFQFVFGFLSYGISFSVCCSTCTGTRMYKKSQQQAKVQDKKVANQYIQQLNQDLSLVHIKVNKNQTEP